MKPDEKLDRSRLTDPIYLKKLFSENHTLMLLAALSELPVIEKCTKNIETAEPLKNVYGRPIGPQSPLTQDEIDGYRYLDAYHRKLYRFISTFPNELRKIIKFRLYRGLSPEQIASVIKAPLHKVEKLLQEGFGQIIVEQFPSFPCDPFQPALQNIKPDTNSSPEQSIHILYRKHNYGWTYLLDQYLRLHITLDEMEELFRQTSTSFIKWEILHRLTEPFYLEYDMKMLAISDPNETWNDLAESKLAAIIFQQRGN